MRVYTWFLGILAAGGFIGIACSKPTPIDTTAAGGSGGHSTTTQHQTTSGPTTTSDSTTTTSAQDVCGSGASFQNAAVDGCLTDNCCNSFNPCNADAACQSCLSGSGTGCDSNALYQAFMTCFDDHCPTDVCGSGIGFSDQTSGDPAFACNGCAADHCCADVTACVGDGSTAAIDLCLACLNGDASCTDATIQGHATSFNSCVGSSCATECGG